MDDLLLPATKHTPRVDFAFSTHTLSLQGEAYPENAVAFFAPLATAIEAYLEAGDAAPLQVRIELRYMNSASTKMIFKLLALLDQAAGRGRAIVLDFAHDADDEMMTEFAEDVAQDFPSLTVRLAHPI